MRKKITRNGNSLALIIERSVCDALGWSAGTELEVQYEIHEGVRRLIATEVKTDEQPLDLLSQLET